MSQWPTYCFHLIFFSHLKVSIPQPANLLPALCFYFLDYLSVIKYLMSYPYPNYHNSLFIARSCCSYSWNIHEYIHFSITPIFFQASPIFHLDLWLIGWNYSIPLIHFLLYSERSFWKRKLNLCPLLHIVEEK